MIEWIILMAIGAAGALWEASQEKEKEKKPAEEEGKK